MVLRVLLDVSEGSIETGFRVTMLIGQSGKPYDREWAGKFPPVPQLLVALRHWQQAYQSWGDSHRWRSITVPPQIIQSSSLDTLKQAKENFQAVFLNWLKSDELWQLRARIMRAVPEHETARLILQTTNSDLQRLPWHLWPLFDECRGLDLTLNAGHAPIGRPIHGPVQVLAIIGGTQGLNIDPDLQALTQLPNCKLTALFQPSRRELCDRLHEGTWDVLYFAGHSHSADDNSKGYIYINDNEYLSPDDLCNALRTAISKGLQLAILNSCQGLGIARQLAELRLPRIIVMREPVLDAVAHTFAHFFLGALSQGQDSDRALRTARQRLYEEIESDTLPTPCPCASWMPVIFQNPLPPPLIWPKKRNLWPLLQGIAALGAIALLGGTGYQMLMAHLWILNHTSAGEQILLNPASLFPKDPRLSSVHILRTQAAKDFSEKDYAQAAQHLTESLRLFKNDPEARIHLNNARIATQSSLKIAASLPLGSNPPIAAEILRGIAQAQEEINQARGINGRKLWIELANDNNNPQDVKPIAHYFVRRSDIFAVVGSNASNTSISAAPIYNQGGLMMLSPTSYSEQLNAEGHNLTATVMAPKARILADTLLSTYLREKPNARIVFCTDRNAMDSTEFIENIVSEINIKQQGKAKVLTQVSNESCRMDAPDIDASTQAQKIREARADTVLFGPHVNNLKPYTNLARALQQPQSPTSPVSPVPSAPKPQPSIQLLGTATLLTDTVLQEGGLALEGMLVVAPWHDRAIPSSVFPQAAQKLWGGRVTWRTAMAYDAVQTLAVGLRRSPTRAGAIQSLQLATEQRFEGATGLIQFGSMSRDRQPTPGLSDILQVQRVSSSRQGLSVDFMPLPATPGDIAPTTTPASNFTSQANVRYNRAP